MDVMPCRHGRRWRPLVRLEWNHLEGHAENFGYLFRELVVFADFIAGPSEAAANHLLAEKLGHERAQAHDVGHGVAIPAFGQHPDAHDAPHVTSGRMKRTLQL